MLALLAAAAAAAAASAAPTASAEVDGTVIAVRIEGTGNERRIALNLSDAVSGEPLRNAEPLGWLYPDDPATGCKAMIAKASNAALGTPGINLNSLRIAAAFADGSLGLVDPQTSFAGTQLEAAFDLGSPGRAMAASPRGDRIAVVTASGKLRLIDAAGTLHEIASRDTPADSAIAWDGDRLLVAGGAGLAVVSGSDGKAIATRDWPLAGKPLLRIAAGQGLLLGSESGPAVLGSPALDKWTELAGIGGLRDAVWLADAAAWAIATQAGGLLLARPGAPVDAVGAVGGASAIAADSEGRFVLAVTDGGTKLTLIDAADGRVLDVRPLPEPADRIVTSRDFAYVHSAGSANVELISFEVVRQQHRISTVDLPFGSERAAAQAPFNRVGVMPGGAAVIGQDGTTLYAYAEGMMVPMGSFAGITRPLAGVAVLDRSLRETAPGSYRTLANVRFGGRYRMPLRIGNPRIDTCLTLDLPGPGRTPAALAGTARFERSELSATARRPVAVGLAAPAAGDTVLALATDMLGRWQRHFPLHRTAAGKFAGRVSFPAPGAYRLIALDARANVSIIKEPTP